MTRAEWLALLVGVPASILAAAAVAAWLMRVNQEAAVFGALKRNPQRWAALVKEVGVFDYIIDAAEVAQRLELENERLHAMIVEKLAPLAQLPTEFAKLGTSVEHFTLEVSRLAKAVEDIPSRLAVLEERTAKAPPDRPPSRRGRP